MSIYSISKIQHRRGKRIDLPHPLSAAEFGWAIDSQELFIGNGSVAEGSPAVGNTKILTEHDDLLQLLSQYQYKANDPTIQTGPGPNFPVKRSLQDRLDDYVSNNAFSINPYIDNQALQFQNSLITLFANPDSRGVESARVVLFFLPGEYRIEDDIYIPSYTTLVGSGIDKTVFRFAPGKKFIFKEDAFFFNDGNHSQSTQSKECYLSNFTVKVDFDSDTFDAAMVLDCTRDSYFSNIKLKNNVGAPLSSTGLFLYSNISDSSTHPVIADTHSNFFENIIFENFKYGVYSYTHTYRNRFSELSYINCTKGIQSGFNGSNTVPNYSSYSDTYGFRYNIIHNSKFVDVYEQGINLVVGTKNVIVLNTFEQVGNNLGTDPLYNQIFFGEDGNYCNGNTFDRDDLYLKTDTNSFIPSVGGSCEYHHAVSNTLSLTNGTIFRLPKIDNSSIVVAYTVKDDDDTRRGHFEIIISKNALTTHFSDEFSHTGTTIGDIIFGSTIDTKAVLVSCSAPTTNSSITYTYTLLN